MTDVQVQLVIVAGLFSLGGVVLGALLAPFTQLYIERKRERRAADRAKLLVAAELLQAQMTLRAVSEGEHWPCYEDPNAFLPTSIDACSFRAASASALIVVCAGRSRPSSISRNRTLIVSLM